MKILKAFFLFFIFAFSSAIYAGWIEDGENKTIIHVKVFELPDPSKTDTFSRAEVAGVKAFRKAFPKIFAKKYRDKYKADPQKYGSHNWDNVEIQLEKFSGIQVEGVEVDLLAIAGGMAPDILYINFRKSDNYIRNNFLYPMDEYFNAISQEEKDFRIHLKLWEVINRKGSDGKKHIWAMPYGGALGKVLLYRKDLFDENNISYPSAEWTWDDLFLAAKKITKPESGIFGMFLSRGKHESWYWITFLWSAGGEIMEYNEDTDEWRCVFDTREAAVALDFYNRLSNEKWMDKKGRYHRGYSSKDDVDAYTKWDRGEIGMQFSYIDEKVFATINPDVVGMAPVPLGPTGIRGAELNSRMMGLFSEIESPAVRDTAWEYILFYDSKEAVEIKTKIMVEGGLGRFVNPKYLEMFGYPEIKRLAPKGWSETFNIAINTGKPEPYGRNSNFAYDMLTIPIQKAEQLELMGKLPEDPEKRLNVLHGLLKDTCARANEIMIGIITPQERMKRRVAAIALLTAIVITFSFVSRKILKVFSPAFQEGLKEKKKWDFRRYIWAYSLLLPGVAAIFIWSYVPLLRGSVMAFFDYKLLGNSVWVGVDNFGDLIFDSFWWKSVWNAFRYSFLVISLTFLPPIFLAIFLQEVPRVKLLFRTIYYLPAVISGLVTVILWKQFYDPSEYGMLNSLMLNTPAIGFIVFGAILFVLAVMFARRLWFYEMYFAMWGFIIVGIILFIACAGLSIPIFSRTGEAFLACLAKLPLRFFDTMNSAGGLPYKWLNDSRTAMLACVIPMVWAGMGPGCLIYLAALQGIPDDYYEAADIDGATFIDKILFVILPTLKVLIIINFIGVFILSWYEAAGNVLVMTGGGANTEIVGLHIWYKAFTFLEFGPATAMAWMLGFMLIGFTVYQLRILSRVEFKTTENRT